MTLAVAIVALLVACGALVVAVRVRRLLGEVNDALAEVAESLSAEAEADSTELWVSDGDLHTPDPAELYRATGALAIYMQEGVPMAVIEGKGAFSLHKLFSDRPRIAAVK